MKTRWVLAVLAAGTLGAWSAPVQAQSVLRFDSAALQAQCTVDPGQCAALVRQIIAGLRALGLPADAFASQLAVIASVVLQVAQADPAAAADLAAALDSVAAASPDPQQAAALAGLAQAVLQGQAGGIDLTTALGASPT